MTLEEELRNDEHWESAYNRLCAKQGITKSDKTEIWRIKELYKSDIIEEIINGTYEWSIPRRVEIAKHGTNKKRVVYVYKIKDRYIQGVLYRAISNYYKDSVSNNCFSYKKDVSTSHAIQYLKENRTSEMKVGVKTDIHAYFNTVSEDKVISMINELFSGGIKQTIENLMLDKRVYWDGQIKEDWKSLMPGSPLGSFFANWCLRELDNEFNELNKTYARYSDDIIVLDSSKEELEKDIEIILSYINKYNLTINEEKYKWFEVGEAVDFLGLELYDNGKIDIAKHAKDKMKTQIHRWCKKGRVEIERGDKSFEQVARNVIRRLNNKNFKCFINNDDTFGWCAYAFPRITTDETLRELDLYTKERLRALKTGRNNKANYRKVSDDELNRLGWVSLVQLYHLFKQDFDYYCEVIELL